MKSETIAPRAFGLWLLASALAGLAWGLPPIAQPPAYHDFADQRACWGVPRCLDTASNGLFVLAGGIGLLFLRRTAGAGAFRERREVLPYRLFFLGTVLVGFGSGYYHLDPDNDRLLWDRLAMMLAFMAWFAAIVGERVSPRALLFDLDDRAVFEFTGSRVSGHTLKHVIAATAVGVVALHLRRRRAL